MKKRVLITGIAGFIGSNLAKSCVSKGWLVDGVDDMSNGHSCFIPKGINFFAYKDFSDEAVLKMINYQDYDYVFHLAAQPRVSYSVEKPVETFDTNVFKTLKLLDACKNKVKRFVFASSSAVYGDVKVLPTTEETSKNPQSPYALQKSVVEEILKLQARLYGLDTVSLRFFNVYGQNQLGGSPYSTAISAWLTAIMKGQSMRCDGDGSQSRDLVHVNDVVQALLLSAQHKKQLNGQVFNVGCGTNITNMSILEFLLKRYEGVKFHYAPTRAGDVKHTCSSIKNIQDTLGYKVSIDPWQGIEQTCKWNEDNKDLIIKLTP